MGMWFHTDSAERIDFRIRLESCVLEDVLRKLKFDTDERVEEMGMFLRTLV